MTTGQELVDLAMTQRGKRYIFGFEVAPGFANFVNAKAWDCSELVERTCGLKGIYIPDGSGAQRQFCKPIPVAQGLKTPGALLFIGNPVHHVAFSRGDGSTIEAKGRQYGVLVQINNAGRFDHAGLIPGVTYGAAPPAPAPTPPPANSLAAVAQGLFFSRQLVLGPGRENPLQAMAYLRAGINRLTGRNLPAEGPWDDAVAQAVIDIQKITGKNELGNCGPLTWATLYP